MLLSIGLFCTEAVLLHRCFGSNAATDAHKRHREMEVCPGCAVVCLHMVERLVGAPSSVLYLCTLMGFTEALWANTSRSDEKTEDYTHVCCVRWAIILCVVYAVYIMPKRLSECVLCV